MPYWALNPTFRQDELPGLRQLTQMKRGPKAKKGSDKKKKKEPAKALKPIGIWVWAQCDNAGCQKWRKLPPGTVVNDNEPW